MKILIYLVDNPMPTEMDYPGEPAEGHQIYLGTEMMEIYSVVPLEKKEDGDPEFSILVRKANSRPPTQENITVKKFLHRLGTILAAMSPEDLLNAFFEDLDKQGKIVH